MKSVRIAGGLGFYGDSWQPIKASIERGNVRYVASDHLAELTLAILQKDRQRDPKLGYTRDLVPMLAELLPLALPRGVKFILNAGGLNPLAAEDRALLTILSDPKWLVNGIRNRDLVSALYATATDDPKEQRRRSARATRLIRLLRAHGLLHKVKNRHLYQVTTSARTSILALLAACDANPEELTTKAA